MVYIRGFKNTHEKVLSDGTEVSYSIERFDGPFKTLEEAIDILEDGRYLYADIVVFEE